MSTTPSMNPQPSGKGGIANIDNSRAIPLTPKLTSDQRQAIEERGGAPVYLVDAVTNASYVLLRAEQFAKMKADTEGDVLEAMYPLLAEIEPDDWEDLSHYDRKP